MNNCCNCWCYYFNYSQCSIFQRLPSFHHSLPTSLPLPASSSLPRNLPLSLLPCLAPWPFSCFLPLLLHSLSSLPFSWLPICVYQVGGCMHLLGHGHSKARAISLTGFEAPTVISIAIHCPKRPPLDTSSLDVISLSDAVTIQTVPDPVRFKFEKPYYY